MNRRELLKAAAVVPLAPTVFSNAAFAQAAYPNRNITMIVPFPPGGQADLAARPIAQALEIPLIAWKEIHEEGGIFSRSDKSNILGLPGRSRSFFAQNFPMLTLPKELDETGWWNRPFEAEEERQPRADQVLADLLARHKDQEGQPQHRIAFVSHGGFFMRLMCAILQLPWRQAALGMRSWFMLNNCSISRFDIHKEEINFAYLNRTDYLPDHLIT